MPAGQSIPGTHYRGYYDFNGNANDLSGNGNNLTASNMVVNSLLGKFNGSSYADSLSGNRGVIRTTTNPFSANQVNVWTISTWVRTITTTLTTNPRVIDIRTATTTSGMGFISILTWTGTQWSVTGDILLTTTNASVGGVLTEQIDTVNTTRWYNLVFVRKSLTELDFYVNGRLESSGTGSGTNTSAVTSPNGKFNLHNGPNSGQTNCLYARMDYTIIEERAWTASEIRKRYTNGLTNFV